MTLRDPCAKGTRCEIRRDRSVSHANRRRRRSASGAAAWDRWRTRLRGDAHRLSRRLRRTSTIWRSHTDFPTDLRQHLSARSPEWAAGITGLSIEAIEDFGKLYGSTQRSYIRAGYGFARSRNGVANMHAVSCLPAVTGAWQHMGGGALWSNRGMYRWNKTLIEGLDAVDTKIRVLDMSRVGSKAHRRSQRRSCAMGRAGSRDADPKSEPAHGVS